MLQCFSRNTFFVKHFLNFDVYDLLFTLQKNGLNINPEIKLIHIKELLIKLNDYLRQEKEYMKSLEQTYSDGFNKTGGWMP